MIQQIKLELYKMLKSKTTYLLAVTLLVPIIFGVGMFFQVSFLVNDGGEGIDVIGGHGISGLDFTMNMMMQIHYITVFLFDMIYAIVHTLEISADFLFYPEMEDTDKRAKLMMNSFNSCSAEHQEIILDLVRCLIYNLQKTND